MAQIHPAEDLNKKKLKDQYLAIRAQLSNIQDAMDNSPTPTQAYASIKYIAGAVDKTLVLLKRFL